MYIPETHFFIDTRRLCNLAHRSGRPNLPAITSLCSAVGDAVGEFLRLEGRMPGEGSFEFPASERDDAGDGERLVGSSSILDLRGPAQNAFPSNVSRDASDHR